MAQWNSKGNDNGEDVELILRKLFVGGIKPDTSDEQFRSYFAKFGNIEDYVHIRNKQTGQSKGFGFVTYTEQKCVDECLSAKPHTINGKDVDVKRAVPKDQPQERCHKIFVGGLPETNEAELKSFFEKYGKVTQCQFKRDQNTGRGRGFGFVSFEDSDTVDKLVIMKHIEFRDKSIECKKAMDVKDKQHMNNGGGHGGGGHHGGNSGHGHNPSVYGAPPPAGYPHPGYPAPPMPAYGAYPPYPGYGAPAAPAPAPTAPGYTPPAAAAAAAPTYPGYPGYPAPAYPQAAPGYPAPQANPYYPQPGQYSQAPSSYGAQKNTYGGSRNTNYKPY